MKFSTTFDSPQTQPVQDYNRGNKKLIFKFYISNFVIVGSPIFQIDAFFPQAMRLSDVYPVQSDSSSLPPAKRMSTEKTAKHWETSTRGSSRYACCTLKAIFAMSIRKSGWRRDSVSLRRKSELSMAVLMASLTDVAQHRQLQEDPGVAKSRETSLTSLQSREKKFISQKLWRNTLNNVS
jgi:hypothetical protein